MAARQNALSELTRFWLESRHECFIRESVPVPVPQGQSDIDFMPFMADGSEFVLPTGHHAGPRLIVECKDEHDFDPKGYDFGKRLLSDVAAFSGLFVPASHPVKTVFSMLKEHHFEVAVRIFGSKEFDRVFVVHALSDTVRRQVTDQLQQLRIHWLTVHELVEDLATWYKAHDRPSGLLHTLTGDTFHLLFGYCNLKAGHVQDGLTKP